MGVLLGCGQGVVFVPEIDSGKLAPMSYHNQYDILTLMLNYIDSTLYQHYFPKRDRCNP